jgi:hypothetical protein
VFAAIKREREAYAAYCATNEVQRRISDQDPCPPLITDGMPDLLHHEKRIVHPLHKAWWAEYQRAEDAHGESAQDLWSARVAFLKTQRTTVAGLRAFVDHIVQFPSHKISNPHQSYPTRECVYIAAGGAQS